MHASVQSVLFAHKVINVELSIVYVAPTSLLDLLYVQNSARLWWRFRHHRKLPRFCSILS